MDRLVIVGTSCSGKTTLAGQLAQRLTVPHIHLDALYWLEDWTARGDDEFRELVADATAGERWVVDGNYSRVRDVVWARATAIVWLNYRLPVVLWRGLRRTVGRVLFRTRLYSGNRERFRTAFLSRDSILLWIVRSHRQRHVEYRRLSASEDYSHLRFFELRSPHQVPALVEHLSRLKEPTTGSRPTPRAR